MFASSEVSLKHISASEDKLRQFLQINTHICWLISTNTLTLKKTKSTRFLIPDLWQNAGEQRWCSSYALRLEQEIRVSIPGLIATISEIGYLLLPSRDMAERSLKRR